MCIFDMKTQPKHLCMCLCVIFASNFDIIGILTLPIVLHMSMIVHAIFSGKDIRIVIIVKFTLECVVYNVWCC